MNSTPTAQDLRDQATAKDLAAQESFERCDTDGALSQWGHGLEAQRLRLEASIVEDGGRAEFRALFDLEGNLVAAKYIETRYGYAWAILADDDPRSRITGWFNESQAMKKATARRNDAKKGYQIGLVKAPAKADFGGGNMLTVMARTVRTDGGFSRDVEIVDNGSQGLAY